MGTLRAVTINKDCAVRLPSQRQSAVSNLSCVSGLGEVPSAANVRGDSPGATLAQDLHLDQLNELTKKN